MKKLAALIMTIILIMGFLPAMSSVQAREGENGYEGGISSGEAAGKTSYDYQEVSFITGEPVVFKGTLILKKQSKSGSITSTYTYNLKNLDKSAALTRTMIMKTTLTKAENGQTLENSELSKITEIIKMGDKVFNLKSYDMSRTALVDARPAVNYYTGNLKSTKVYQNGTGTGTAAQGGTIRVEASGTFTGYDNYWGSSEVEDLSYTITSEQKKDKDIVRWGGTARASLSSTVVKKINYVKKDVDQFSIPGGYVQTQYNKSILEYSGKLPEFDSKGNPTDNILNPKGSLKLETAPVQTRLPVSDLIEIKGHPAEKDIELLSSLEVINSSSFLKPERFITRAEFIAAVVKAAREVPADPALTSKLAMSRKTKQQEVVSPFNDVSVENLYFEQINSALKRGIISGKNNAVFSPNDGVTVADAMTVFIKALGLESLSSSTNALTTFKDNDLIPNYARSSIYVANKIGLANGDGKGYIKPGERLTKAKAASLLNALITYMQDGISKDYRDRFVNYN